MAFRAYCGGLMSVVDTHQGKGVLINSGKSWYTLTVNEFQEDIDEVIDRMDENEGRFYLWYDYGIGGDVN